MNPVAAVYAALAATSAVTSKLGRTPPGIPYWLFQDKHEAKVEGSGKVSLTVLDSGTWDIPNQHNHMEFPQVMLEYRADSTRDSGGAVLELDAREKIIAVHQEVEKILRRTHSEEVVWGGLRVLGCRRLEGPLYFPLEDNKDGRRAVVYYGLTVG